MKSPGVDPTGLMQSQWNEPPGRTSELAVACFFDGAAVHGVIVV